MKQLILVCTLLMAAACQPFAQIATPTPASSVANDDLLKHTSESDTPTAEDATITVTLTPRLANLDRPGYIFALPDGTPAVIEQVGMVRRLTDASIWLDMRDIVDAGSSERGLFSAAVSPFSQEIFLSYTRTSDSATVVSRVPLVNNQPDLERMTLVIAIEQPYANHNGGFIAFGPDQLLYIATGDGGSGNDPQNVAQNPQSWLGKVLRIDVRDVQVPYAIPEGQPVDLAWLPEIVAIGLRNPWRFGFLEKTSIWIADVGQNKREELNLVALADLPTTNFGWRIREGDVCRQVGDPDCDTLLFTDPVAAYTHDAGHCSITGGDVLLHPRMPSTHAILYGDFCSGVMWLWDAQSGAQIIADTELQISSFGRGDDGAIYVSDYRDGQVYQLTIK